MRLIEDERGLQWSVERGDPAWGRVERLWKRGYRLIVLPRTVVLGGEYEETPVGITALPANTALRLQRLRQCREE